MPAVALAVLLSPVQPQNAAAVRTGVPMIAQHASAFVTGESPAMVVPATEIAGRLEEGEVIDLAGVTVTGELDLGDLQIVHSPLRCFGCVFTGSLLARDVIFERVLDLSGSQVDGSIDFLGAVFEGGLLLRGSPEHPARVSGPASFAQAAFGDGTGFDQATFADSSDFTGSSFLGDSSFADTLFEGDADFDDVSFGGNTRFSSLAGPGPAQPAELLGECLPPVMGAFGGIASFTQAAFRGAADFRQRCFSGAASFQGATFGERVDFAKANFHSDVVLDGASFESDASFLASIFETEASFLRVSASESLVFDDAIFGGEAGFFELAVSGTLSLQGSQFLDGVDLRRAPVGDLIMDLADVANVEGREGERGDVLALIETSAAERGDLALANDASFQLLALQNSQLGWFPRAMDWFFYRLLAGYLVRPLYPLLAFVALLVVGALIRTALRLRRDQPRLDRARGGAGPRSSMAERGHARLLRATMLASAFFGRLGDTVQVAFKRKPEITLEETDRVRPYAAAGLKWVEFLAFKILIALFLLALASSNATLKRLIDSVRG